MEKGWIGVDLDGTLAHYDEWRGPEHIGEPIGPMVERVKQWLAEGQRVKIFTARVYKEDLPGLNHHIIRCWCEAHIGVALEVTCTKDFTMTQLWDDRAIQVERNTGRVIG